MHNFGHLVDSFNVVLDDDDSDELPLMVARSKARYSRRPCNGGARKTITYSRTGQPLVGGRNLHANGDHYNAYLCGRANAVQNHTFVDSNGHEKQDHAMDGVFSAGHNAKKGGNGRRGCEVFSTAGLYTCSEDLNDDDLSLRHWIDVKSVEYVACPQDHDWNSKRRRYANAAKQASHKREIMNREGRQEHQLKKAGMHISSNRQVLSPLILNIRDDRSYTDVCSLRHLNGKQEDIQKMGAKGRYGATDQDVSSWKERGETRMGEAPAGSLSNFRKEIILQGLPQGCKGFLFDNEPGKELQGNRYGLPGRLLDKKEQIDLGVKGGSGATSMSHGRVHKSTDMDAVLGQSLPSNKGGIYTEGNGESASHYPGKLVPDAENASGRKHAQVRVHRCEHDTPLVGKNGAESVERPRTLSQKYRPRTFKDLVGQNLVARALINAACTGKVAPAYLFQGSHGTGKTSAARIFAAALNCVTAGGQRPCGVCTECAALMAGKSRGLWEIEAAHHNDTTSLKGLIEGMVSATSCPRYRVLAIDGCHVLSHETWCALLKVLEEPPANVVFLLITTQPQKLPLTVVSRCQRFHFLKIRHVDLVRRLESLLKLENLDAEPGALNLIASKSEGCLRDAETTLDQLSLIEHRITQATIHKMVGSVPDKNHLLSLLDFALCCDTASTVRRTKDLINCGVEPLDLLCQVASLIVDILAGSCTLTRSDQNKACSSIHALSDLEMEKLRAALKILLGAEKQVKAASKHRMTWLIAALLQFGESQRTKLHASTPTTIPEAHPKVTKANEMKEFKLLSERAQKKCTKRDFFCDKKGSGSTKVGLEVQMHPLNHHTDPSSTSQAAKDSFSYGTSIDLHLMSPSNLGCIWQKMLKACTQPSLTQLLQCHGILKALTFFEVKAVAQLEFSKPEHKLEAEMYRMCIKDTLERVLGLPVDVDMNSVSKCGCCSGDESTLSSVAAKDAVALTLDVSSAIDNARLSSNFKSVQSGIDCFSLQTVMADMGSHQHPSAILCFSTSGTRQPKPADGWLDEHVGSMQSSSASRMHEERCCNSESVASNWSQIEMLDCRIFERTSLASPKNLLRSQKISLGRKNIVKRQRRLCWKMGRREGQKKKATQSRKGMSIRLCCCRPLRLP